MPYISTEEVSIIRKAIKSAFPKFKFSITKHHRSTLVVALMESPMAFDSGYKNVSVNWLKKETYTQEQIDFFIKLDGIINANKEQKEQQYDSDYGSIPNFYYEIQVGTWNKPHKQIIK